MKLRDCHPFDEIFEHRDEHTGERRFFNATKLAAYAVEHGLACKVDFGAEFVRFIEKHRGVEEWKIQRLCEPYLSEPITAIEMEDGSTLTVDGHHRTVRHFRDTGKTEMCAYRLSLGQWEPFVVEDFPPELADAAVRYT